LAPNEEIPCPACRPYDAFAYYVEQHSDGDFHNPEAIALAIVNHSRRRWGLAPIDPTRPPAVSPGAFKVMFLLGILGWFGMLLVASMVWSAFRK
jgi:hypothetical protein